MTESVFNYTEGLSSEDLTTEILRYILVSPEFAPYQRLFYSRLFSSVEPTQLKSTDDYGFSVSTQVSYDKYGRPDLIIENENRLVVIENKFYAEFTNDDQIRRYFQFLCSTTNFEEKFLILLTIKDRSDYYYNRILQQFSKDLPEPSLQAFDTFTAQNNIIFRILSWDDLLEDFDSPEFLITNLKNYIYGKFIKSSTLDDDELKLVQGSEVPKLFEDL
jgi:hypothetical protein